MRQTDRQTDSKGVREPLPFQQGLTEQGQAEGDARTMLAV